jgi:hypothetical protein
MPRIPLTWRNVTRNVGSGAAAFGRNAIGFGNAAITGADIFTQDMREREALEDQRLTAEHINAALQGRPLPFNRRINAIGLQDALINQEAHRELVETSNLTQAGLGYENEALAFAQANRDADRRLAMEATQAGITADTAAANRAKLESDIARNIYQKGLRHEAALDELERTFARDVEERKGQKSEIIKETAKNKADYMVDRLNTMIEKGATVDELRDEAFIMSVDAEKTLDLQDNIIAQEAMSDVVRRHAQNPNQAALLGLPRALYDTSSVGQLVSADLQRSIQADNERQARANERATFQRGILDETAGGQNFLGVLVTPNGDFRIARDNAEKAGNKITQEAFIRSVRNKGYDKGDISDHILKSMHDELHGNASGLNKIIAKIDPKRLNEEKLIEQAQTQAAGMQKFAETKRAEGLTDPTNFGSLDVLRRTTTEAADARFLRDDEGRPIPERRTIATDDPHLETQLIDALDMIDKLRDDKPNMHYRQRDILDRAETIFTDGTENLRNPASRTFGYTKVYNDAELTKELREFEQYMERIGRGN